MLLVKKLENSSTAQAQELLQNEKVKKTISSLSQENLHGILNDSGPIVLSEFYYCIKPMRNDVLSLLEDLRSYKVKLVDLKEEILKRNIS